MALIFAAVKLVKAGAKAIKEHQELQKAGNVDPFVQPSPRVAPSSAEHQVEIGRYDGVEPSSHRNASGQRGKASETPGASAAPADQATTYSDCLDDIRPTFDKSAYIAEDYGAQDRTREKHHPCEPPPTYDEAVSLPPPSPITSPGPSTSNRALQHTPQGYPPRPSATRSHSCSSCSSDEDDEHGVVPPGYTYSNGRPLSYKAYRKLLRAERRVERERLRVEERYGRDTRREMKRAAMEERRVAKAMYRSPGWQ